MRPPFKNIDILFYPTSPSNLPHGEDLTFIYKETANFYRQIVVLILFILPNRPVTSQGNYRTTRYFCSKIKFKTGWFFSIKETY